MQGIDHFLAGTADFALGQEAIGCTGSIVVFDHIGLETVRIKSSLRCEGRIPVLIGRDVLAVIPAFDAQPDIRFPEIEHGAKHSVLPHVHREVFFPLACDFRHCKCVIRVEHFPFHFCEEFLNSFSSGDHALHLAQTVFVIRKKASQRLRLFNIHDRIDPEAADTAA